MAGIGFSQLLGDASNYVGEGSDILSAASQITGPTTPSDVSGNPEPMPFSGTPAIVTNRRKTPWGWIIGGAVLVGAVVVGLVYLLKK